MKDSYYLISINYGGVGQENNYTPFFIIEDEYVKFVEEDIEEFTDKMVYLVLATKEYINCEGVFKKRYFPSEDSVRFKSTRISNKEYEEINDNYNWYKHRDIPRGSHLDMIDYYCKVQLECLNYDDFISKFTSSNSNNNIRK